MYYRVVRAQLFFCCIVALSSALYAADNKATEQSTAQRIVQPGIVAAYALTLDLPMPSMHERRASQGAYRPHETDHGEYRGWLITMLPPASQRLSEFMH